MLHNALIVTWCDSTACLHGEPPAWEVVDKRLQRVDVHLVPWTRSLDGVADEIERGVIRCPPDQRIAVRDLVVTRRALAAAVVDGACTWIDRAEVLLALYRIECGFSEYVSPRVRAYRAETWLGFSDTDEWPLTNAEDWKTACGRMLGDRRAIPYMDSRRVLQREERNDP